METVPGVLQQLCNWHFVQENTGIEPHGLGKQLGKSKSALFYLKSETGMAKQAFSDNPILRESGFAFRQTDLGRIRCIGHAARALRKHRVQ